MFKRFATVLLVGLMALVLIAGVGTLVMTQTAHSTMAHAYAWVLRWQWWLLLLRCTCWLVLIMEWPRLTDYLARRGNWSDAETAVFRRYRWRALAFIVVLEAILLGAASIRPPLELD
jgi:hypothetical protein